MLDINVTIKGENIIISNLGKFADKAPGAIRAGLSEVVRGIHPEALEFLSGAGAKASNASPGGYPVPRRTGHLARMLDFLEPGQSKSTEGHTIKLGNMEAAIFDSAEYAAVIHEGKGSSAKFGPRRFLTDALEEFNRGDRIKEVIEDEINKVKKESGL